MNKHKQCPLHNQGGFWRQSLQLDNESRASLSKFSEAFLQRTITYAKRKHLKLVHIRPVISAGAVYELPGTVMNSRYGNSLSFWRKSW